MESGLKLKQTDVEIRLFLFLLSQKCFTFKTS